MATIDEKAQDDLGYSPALELLIAKEMPFLIGGAFAFAHYSDVRRMTKDLDLFCKPVDYPHILQVLAAAGYEVRICDPDWIAMALSDSYRVDVIFAAANRLYIVDDSWFEHAVEAELHGHKVKMVSVEDMIYSKSYVQERDRFDGADIHHMIRKQGPTMNWRRLLARMDAHWELLLATVIMFRFVYPSERSKVPDWLIRELIERQQRQMDLPVPNDPICRGPLLAWNQYRIDTCSWNYRT